MGTCPDALYRSVMPSPRVWHDGDSQTGHDISQMCSTPPIHLVRRIKEHTVWSHGIDLALAGSLGSLHVASCPAQKATKCKLTLAAHPTELLVPRNFGPYAELPAFVLEWLGPFEGRIEGAVASEWLGCADDKKLI